MKIMLRSARPIPVLILTMLCASAALGALATEVTSTPATTTSSAAGRAVIVSIDGAIDDSTERFVTKRLADARALGADTVILKLNTPGGLAKAGLDISRTLKRQDDLHVIAYVEEMALSAGAMIALAADEIVMQPGAMIGDAAPISISPTGGLNTLGAAERAKAESPILADFRESALKNGHDVLLAEAMVSAPRVVHWVQNTAGERRFVGDEDFKRLAGEGWRTVDEPAVPSPLDGPDTLLTLHDQAAVKVGLASGTAPNAAALAQARGLSVIQNFAPSTGDRIVGWLASAPVRFLLLVVFLVSLYAAVHAPGHGMAEVLALVTLGMLVGLPLLTGYARWWEVFAILLGLVLLAIELFLIPGFGVTGFSGIVLILFGLILTFVGNTGLPGTWRMPSIWSGVQTGLTVVVGALLSSFVVFMLIRKYLPKLPYMNRLILAPVPAAGPGAADDVWPFVGTLGRTMTDLKPGGTAQFPYADDTRAASVVSDSGFVPAGERVVVHEVHGNRIVVRKV